MPQLTGVPREWAMQLLRLKQLHGVSGRLMLPPSEYPREAAEGVVYLQTPQAATTMRLSSIVAFWTLHRAAHDDAEKPVLALRRDTLGRVDVADRVVRAAREAELDAHAAFAFEPPSPFGAWNGDFSAGASAESSTAPSSTEAQ